MSSNPFTKPVALLVVLAAISGPAAALASSGDDQYCDPFNGCGGSTSTTTSSKPKPGGGGGSGSQTGGAGQGSGSQGASQGSADPSTPVSSGSGSGGAGSGPSSPARAVETAAEKAKRLAERKALTAKYAVAVLDAAGLSPVRMTIVAR